MELGELTAPALWPLGSQFAATNLYVRKGKVKMAERDNGELILDDVNLVEVSIMLVSRFN